MNDLGEFDEKITESLKNIITQNFLENLFLLESPLNWLNKLKYGDDGIRTSLYITSRSKIFMLQDYLQPPAKFEWNITLMRIKQKIALYLYEEPFTKFRMIFSPPFSVTSRGSNICDEKIRSSPHDYERCEDPFPPIHR